MGTRPNLLKQVERRANRTYTVRAFLRHWFTYAVILLGIYNVLPFAAPVAMRFGWTGVGNVIYDLYSTQCHQMAQRSFFLFGERLMYLVDDLPIVQSNPGFTDVLALRDYRGDDVLGWKVAWSDRMVYLYGSLWLAVFFYGFKSRRGVGKPLPLWAFVLFLLPMAVDGSTHFLSDLSGLTAGFRYDNAWLGELTQYAFPSGFYAGDALGSFNSYARMISSALVGIGAAWVILPWVDQEVGRTVSILDKKLARYHLYLNAVKSDEMLLRRETR